MEIKTGIKGNTSLTVTEAMSAKELGSGLLPVYSTPSLVALMENTCSNSMLDYMDEELTQMSPDCSGSLQPEQL